MTAPPDDAYVLRPATLDDLPDLERMAEAAAVGITTLPADRQALQERLERSLQAFATTDDASGEEIYHFVLEHTTSGQLVGTSGIAASAGFADRFYSYRNEMVVHASAALGQSNRIHTLHLCHDLTGHTLLTSFYIDPAHAHTAAPQLLSRGRLLFIAEFAERFADRIAAESPGLADDAGRCPFWDAVGRQFFDMDYPAVERLAGGRSKAFIAEMMPHSPVYVPLLPEAAQWAIGQLHPQAELPFSILLDEGFDTETYVDIFDGGPTVDARLAMLRSVRNAWRGRLTVHPPEAADRPAAPATPEARPWLLATTDRNRFRATVGPLVRQGDALQGPADLLARLGATPGTRVRATPLASPEENTP